MPATPQSPARSEAVVAVADAKATTPTVQSSEWDESKEPEVVPTVAVDVDNIDLADFDLADYAEYLDGDVDFGDIDVDNLDLSEFAEYL